MQKMSKLNCINLFFRSLLFSIFMITFTTIYSFFCVLSFPLPFRTRYNIIIFWTSTILWVLKKLCHINYQIEGLENIPKDRSGVVLSKHQSTWETFFLPSIFDRSAIIVKRELLWVPFWGWGLAIIEPIAINRANAMSAMSQIIKKGKKCLDEGRWIVVFPEGTRTAPGEVGDYRVGGAQLAVKTGYPVIPVAHNAGYFWPKRKFIKRPGIIRIVIGPLIETKGRKADEVLQEAKGWIEATMLKIKCPSQREC